MQRLRNKLESAEDVKAGPFAALLGCISVAPLRMTRVEDDKMDDDKRRELQKIEMPKIDGMREGRS